MKKTYRVLFLGVFIIMFILTGCGSDSPAPVVNTSIVNYNDAWNKLEKCDISDSAVLFNQILQNESDEQLINEAKVGLSLINLSSEPKDITKAQTYLEEVFSYSYDTVYQPYYNENVDNGDARAMLAMTYMLQGDTEKFNTNLNLARQFSDSSYDTKNMIDSLLELLN